MIKRAVQPTLCKKKTVLLDSAGTDGEPVNTLDRVAILIFEGGELAKDKARRLLCSQPLHQRAQRNTGQRPKQAPVARAQACYGRAGADAAQAPAHAEPGRADGGVTVP